MNLENAAKGGVWRGEVSEDELAWTERILGCPLPQEFRGFAAKYGCGSIEGLRVYGLGVPATGIPSVVYATILARGEEENFPLDWLVIGSTGDGGYHCLDQSGQVLVWVAGETQGAQECQRVAPSFSAWISQETSRNG